MIDNLLIDTIKIKQQYEENLYKIRCEFLKSVCDFEDFIEGYVNKEDRDIIIFIDNCCFSNNKRYYKALRDDFLKNKNLPIDISLFDKEEIEAYKDSYLIDNTSFKCISTTK
ncbi:hypothetical protein FJ641_10565 [Clostridium perfringens]|nr:hypothetical protein [Clostridium perfringens]